MIKLSEEQTEELITSRNIPLDHVFSISDDLPIVPELIKSYNSRSELEEIVNTADKPRFAWMIASTNEKDMQQEVVEQSGMDLETYFVKHGRIKWEHSDKTLKGPEAYIGYPIVYRKLEDKTLVIFAIYPESANMKVANDAWRLIQAASKTSKPIGASIEGVTSKRHGKKILSSRVYNIVLTANPVNPDTEVHPLSKSMLEEIDTALCELSKGLSVYPHSADMSRKTGGDTVLEENKTGKKNTPGRGKMKKGLRKICKEVDSPEDLRKRAKGEGFSDDEIEKAVDAFFGEDEDEQTEKSLLEDIKKSLGDVQESLDNLYDDEEEVEKSMNFEDFDVDDDDDVDREEINKSIITIAESVRNGQTTQKTLLETQKTVLKSLLSLTEKLENLDKSVKVVENSSASAPELYKTESYEDGDVSLPNYTTAMNKSLEAVKGGVITDEDRSQFLNALRHRSRPDALSLAKSIWTKIK